MPRQEYSVKTQSKTDHDIHNGRGYSLSTKTALVEYLEIPPQSAIYIQGKTQDKQIEMFSRGFEVVNDSGNQGIDIAISLYQGCTSDTEVSNVLDHSLNNSGGVGSLLVNTNPLNVVLGTYRGDLSNSVYTQNREVSKSVDADSEYIMPLNDKSIIEVQNFLNIDTLKIAFYWRYVERG